MEKHWKHARIINGDTIILIDSRERHGEYIQNALTKIGVECEVCGLPYQSGADYYISNTRGSCAIQRKDSMKEICGHPVSDKYESAMEELRLDILPRLVTYTSNPILLVEESHIIGEMGSLFRKENGLYVETGMSATSYYGFLESVRMMGVDVVTLHATGDLYPTIWYLAAMDGYLSREHYPKHLKTHKPYQSAIGMLCCVPGIGQKRAEKALQKHSLKEMVELEQIDGLTKPMISKLKKVLEVKI